MTSSDSTQAGQPPTRRSENLEEAARELAPHHSLGRVESTARFILGTVGIVGALITGFGAFGSSPAAEHPWWLLPSLTFTAVSIVLALFAAMGSPDEVNVDDLEDVDSYFADQIERRGTLVRMAGIALAISIVLAIAPAVIATGDSRPQGSPGSTFFFSGLTIGLLPPCHPVSGPAPVACSAREPDRSRRGAAPDHPRWRP